MNARDLVVNLQAELRERGCPLPVVDGPEPTKTATWGRERIVLEHDFDGKDSFTAPKSQSARQRRYEAGEAYKLTIYARSAKAGATPFEHRVRAQAVRNTAITALEYVIKSRKNGFRLGAGGFFVPADLAASERHAGAAYEIKFVYESPIAAVTFPSAAGERWIDGSTGEPGAAGRINSVDTDAQVSQGDSDPESARHVLVEET